MDKPRKLALRRDVLQELSTDELLGVAGGAKQTQYSCLDYISCYWVQCLPTLDRCIDPG